MDLPSEAQLHPKLNLPRAGGKVRLPFLKGRLAEHIAIEGEVSELAEREAIELVAALGAEL